MILWEMDSSEETGELRESPDKSAGLEFEKNDLNESKGEPGINSGLCGALSVCHSNLRNSESAHSSLPKDSEEVGGNGNFSYSHETAPSGLPKGSEELSENEKLMSCEMGDSETPTAANLKNLDILQNDPSTVENLTQIADPFLHDSVDSSKEHNVISQVTSNGNLSEVIIKTSKPLCADYQSDTESEIDSESDSSTSSTDSTTETSSDDGHDSRRVKSKTVEWEKKPKEDLSLSDLPPIENLSITVPEDDCVEIGTITSIVDTLVIVESYNGTAALDIDTVLFLDSGRQTLGKVFEILGPISEPVYAVRFNSQEQINALNIKKNMKVYYAPKTEHTTFVFLSEVLKYKGSDASWKDNTEAPPEFQDFSDDEEERLFKKKQSKESNGETFIQKEQNKSRKRPFNAGKHPAGVQQPTRQRNPNFPQQRPNFQANPVAPFAGTSTTFPNPVRGFPFPYRLPPHPPFPPHFLHPPRLTGPPFPTFGGAPFFNLGQNLQQPFHQQRMHSFPQSFPAWGRPGFGPPPPPPPPPTEQPSTARPNGTGAKPSERWTSSAVPR